MDIYVPSRLWTEFLYFHSRGLFSFVFAFHKYMLLKYQKINEICAYSVAKHQKPYSLYVLNCIEFTCTSCPSSSPDSRSLPRRTYRTILWDMWANWVSRDVFPSPASKLLYSNKLKLNTSLTSLRYVRTAVL